MGRRQIAALDHAPDSSVTARLECCDYRQSDDCRGGEFIEVPERVGDAGRIAVLRHLKSFYECAKAALVGRRQVCALKISGFVLLWLRNRCVPFATDFVACTSLLSF
jgi:hypothetical protein